MRFDILIPISILIDSLSTAVVKKPKNSEIASAVNKKKVRQYRRMDLVVMLSSASRNGTDIRVLHFIAQFQSAESNGSDSYKHRKGDGKQAEEKWGRPCYSR